MFTFYRGDMWRRRSTPTSKSYLPTKWSADTDRAIERSSETAVAMTAATIGKVKKQRMDFKE
jgi:hypothetical protein